VLGADGAWDIAVNIFMKSVEAQISAGASKADALKNTLFELGERCERNGLEAGYFRNALANVYAATLIPEVGVDGTAVSFEELARLVRDQYEPPKGKVN
jgi:hypothetical protein